MAGVLESPVFVEKDNLHLSNAEDFRDLDVDDVVGLSLDARITSISHSEEGWFVNLEILSRRVHKDAQNMEEASTRAVREFERSGGIVPSPG